MVRKLTVEDVRHMRKLYRGGHTSRAGLAKMYNVSWNCVDAVVKYRTWKQAAAR